MFRLPKALLRNNSLHRLFSETASKPSSGTGLLIGATVVGAAGGYVYYISTKPLDYQEVYNAIAKKLENVNHDDGSFGPILLRLAWHAAGTYDKTTKTGGSNGSTMRFDPECNHGANAGLKVARDLLESVKEKYPKVSYADLWSLAGVVSVQEMGGPYIYVDNLELLNGEVVVVMQNQQHFALHKIDSPMPHSNKNIFAILYFKTTYFSFTVWDLTIKK